MKICRSTIEKKPLKIKNKYMQNKMHPVKQKTSKKQHDRRQFAHDSSGEAENQQETTRSPTIRT